MLFCARHSTGITARIKIRNFTGIVTPQKLSRSWPWKARSLLFDVVTPNVPIPGVNEGAPGSGWFRTFVASTRSWKVFDSVRWNDLLAFISRVHCPKDL